MPRQDVLSAAKTANRNEFYTQYVDIEREVNAYVEYNPDVFRGKTVLLPCDDPEWSNFTKYFATNFERFGLKKLISTSYAKGWANAHQLSMFESTSAEYDPEKHETRGKLFILEKDKNGSGKIDLDDIEFSYMEGDGDFRSEEVTRLRNESDYIITNPPFNTLFREFFAWVIESGKKFLFIASINSITYKEVFPYIQRNEIWLGTGMGRWISGFIVPNDYELYGTEAGLNEKGQRVVATNNCLWYTNIDHGKRHELLTLMTMTQNLKYNKKLKKKFEKEYDISEYPHYDNYDAIEIPFTECIPSDYDGLMGVPITFLDKYNPEQFEIVGFAGGWNGKSDLVTRKYPTKQVQHDKTGKEQYVGKMNDGTPQIKICFCPKSVTYYSIDDEYYYLRTYGRVLIRAKRGVES